VVASWLGLDGTITRLFDSSLAARASLVVTVIASMAASALFIINKSGIETSLFAGSMARASSLAGISKTWWAGITGVAVVNALCIAYVYLMRAWRFAYLASITRSAEQ